MENNHESGFTLKGVLNVITQNLDSSDHRPTVPLGHGDPSLFPNSFRTALEAEDALVQAIRSANFNCLSPSFGILPARRSVAEYLSRNLPNALSPEDVFLTCGANHAIEVVMTALARPGANVLLPKPGFPSYHVRAAFSNLEVRYFDLLPEKGWEVDLDGLEALADDKTVAMVIINPGNPCGSVLTYDHLKKVAETAKKLGILLIADEVYENLAFGNNPFVPMGVFGSIAPVLTLGSISKRWIVPGWRLGWIAITDPNGILQETWIMKSLKSYLGITALPATIVQGAIGQIIEKTPDAFYVKIIETLKEGANICYERIKEIPCITCPNRPEGAMSIMVKLNLALMDDIRDDMDFCTKLAKEESVIVLPGFVVGLKNWLRISFSVDPPLLEDGMERLKVFCLRHTKKQ